MLRHFQGNAGAVQTLQQHADLLRACREESIAVAYARVGGGEAPADEPTPEQEIADSLAAWINTPTWAESRAYLEAHPALLDPATDAVIAATLHAAAGNAGVVQMLQQHAALLRACREEGIAAAYARVGGGG